MSDLSTRAGAPAPKLNLNIQALRAVAALLVVVGHAAHETQAMPQVAGRASAEMAFLYWGFGVDIFFVISGFIMVYTSAELFGRPGAWGIFLRRRLIRIVPLYWLLTTVLLLGALVAPRLLNVPIGDWQYVLSSYLFIPSLRAGVEIRPVMALGWTLNMEMFFYVLFAGALFLPFRAGIAALAATIIGFATVGFIVRPEQVQLAFWTQSIVLEFLFGCLLAVAFLKGARLTALAAILVALLGFVAMFRVPQLDQALPEALRWGVPALLIVAAAALSPHATTRLTAWLAVLGDASYSLYLSHPFVLRPMRNLWVSLVADGVPLAVYIVAATLVATALSVLLHRWVERPLVKATQTAFGPRRHAQPAMAPSAPA